MEKLVLGVDLDLERHLLVLELVLRHIILILVLLIVIILILVLLIVIILVNLLFLVFLNNVLVIRERDLESLLEDLLLCLLLHRLKLLASHLNLAKKLLLLLEVLGHCLPDGGLHDFLHKLLDLFLRLFLGLHRSLHQLLGFLLGLLACLLSSLGHSLLGSNPCFLSSLGLGLLNLRELLGLGLRELLGGGELSHNRKLWADKFEVFDKKHCGVLGFIRNWSPGSNDNHVSK
ncbi:hypothetical protein ATCV1_z764L [Acanthocystis turfacea chlorella virus 1]|uniref:Uncharacterized protein z764L n=1 Tax=Chlorovirus heliozoae TaxID=322019 RepID=A7KA24_9PHYC|nr:hypothetical protein ATCV1_z764L [Acanthocystis turfacea chlorella virus 1]ABT16898.1 hypothetical protein ATCV1_z764L [Acanthocystis turfacea chlorella virus 1]